MNSQKMTALTLRLNLAAELEHRSITNMVEVLIREYCGQHDIAIAKPSLTGSQKGNN